MYGDRELERESEIDGILSPAVAEHLYSFSPKSAIFSDITDTSSVMSKMSKATYTTNQSIISPININFSLCDNCPYEYNSDELNGFDEIVDFITKMFVRIDSEMQIFVSNSKTYKEKQVCI